MFFRHNVCENSYGVCNILGESSHDFSLNLQEMSLNLVIKFRLVQNSHKLLSKSLGCGKENLQSAAGIV